VAVPQSSIPPALRDLAGLGLYAEPTSAIVVAALPEFVRRGAIAGGDTVVGVLSGTGLKAAHVMARLLGDDS